MSEIETTKLETFTLVKERCMLANMNIRTEMHGDERKRAVDLQFDFSGANNLLAKLHQDLRHAFYKSQDTRDMVTEDHTPVLRFPLMGAVSWDLEIPHTRLHLHGETPADDVILGDGKTNKFKLVMLDGGTVKWHFRVQFSNPDDKAIAGLSRFLNDTVPVSLKCRDIEDEGDNFDKVEQLSLTPMSEARQKAEGLFAQPGDVVDNLFAQSGTDMALADAEPATDIEFVNDGAQPGDSGHGYAAAPDDVVDAEFIPPADEVIPAVNETIDMMHDDLDPPAPAASNVAPIGKRRTARKVAGGGNLE